MSSLGNRRSKSSLGVMAALAATMGILHVPVGTTDSTRHSIFGGPLRLSKEDEEFLATKDKNGRELWMRRFRRGLKTEERKFIDDRVAELRGQV